MKPWTEADIRRLRTLAASGNSGKEAADILGRTYFAVRTRANTENISFHSIRNNDAQVAARREKSRRRVDNLGTREPSAEPDYTAIRERANADRLREIALAKAEADPDKPYRGGWPS